MLTIKGPSEKPCFICGGKDQTAEVKFADGTFRGVLCMNDIFKKIKTEVKRADGESSRKPA